VNRCCTVLNFSRPPFPFFTHRCSSTSSEVRETKVRSLRHPFVPMPAPHSETHFKKSNELVGRKILASQSQLGIAVRSALTDTPSELECVCSREYGRPEALAWVGRQCAKVCRARDPRVPVSKKTKGEGGDWLAWVLRTVELYPQ